MESTGFALDSSFGSSFSVSVLCVSVRYDNDAVGVSQQHQQLFYNKLFFLRNGNSQRARASRNKQQNKNEQLKIGGEDKCQRGASERGDGMSGTETEIIWDETKTKRKRRRRRRRVWYFTAVMCM